MDSRVTATLKSSTDTDVWDYTDERLSLNRIVFASKDIESTQLTRQQAKIACPQGWRLPTNAECCLWYALTDDFQCDNQMVAQEGFRSGGYWTADEGGFGDKGDGIFSWSAGTASCGWNDSKKCYVRCVRDV